MDIEAALSLTDKKERKELKASNEITCWRITGDRLGYNGTSNKYRETSL